MRGSSARSPGLPHISESSYLSAPQIFINRPKEATRSSCFSDQVVRKVVPLVSEGLRLLWRFLVGLSCFQAREVFSLRCRLSLDFLVGSVCLSSLVNWLLTRCSLGAKLLPDCHNCIINSYSRFPKPFPRERPHQPPSRSHCADSSSGQGAR